MAKEFYEVTCYLWGAKKIGECLYRPSCVGSSIQFALDGSLIITNRPVCFTRLVPRTNEQKPTHQITWAEPEDEIINHADVFGQPRTFADGSVTFFESSENTDHFREVVLYNCEYFITEI